MRRCVPYRGASRRPPGSRRRPTRARCRAASANGHCEPALGELPSRAPMRVRRIGEGDVVARRAPSAADELAAHRRDGPSPRSPAPSRSTFARDRVERSPARSRRSRTLAAPRDSASRPSAPEPANRSSTRASGSRALHDAHPRLAHAIAGRSHRVARAAPRSGGRASAPRRCARVSGPVASATARRRRGAPAGALSPRYSSRSSRNAMSTRLDSRELGATRAPGPSRCASIAPAAVLRAAACRPSSPTARGGADERTPRDHEHRRRIAHAERLEVAQQRLELVVRVVERRSRGRRAARARGRPA